MTTVDLHNTSRCPRGTRCESCGTEAGPLSVETPNAGRLGVMCLTQCRRCAGSGVVPPVSVATAMRLVVQHATHLGVSMSQMSDAMQDDHS